MNKTPLLTDAHNQLDYALERGINFIDTAEMYPSCAQRRNASATESYIGQWLEKSGKREKVVLATKVSTAREVSPIFERISL
ncbi:aldo/keto reductase [Vibrio sp. PP-XX7]